MNSSLDNDHISVQVDPTGAELTSVRMKETGIEYLWQAHPAVWARHAPVLFPIVGKLRHDQYQWNGQPYQLSQHGFARDQLFDVQAHSATELTLVLRDNDDTRRVYPFAFELRIGYTLEGNRIRVDYGVSNPGQSELWFSIGAHPGFNCPLLPDETFEDYFIEFEQPETLDRYLLEGGLFNGHTEPFLQNSRTLPLTRHLFARDAIVVKGFQSASLALRSRRHHHSVTMTFAGFPYLGIWTKDAHSPFLCLEPWYGLADRTDASGKWPDKEGIIHLAAGEAFHCQYTLAFQ